MRLLICGLGSIGRRHLRNLRQLGGHELALYRTGRSTLPENELEGLQSFSDLSDALREFRPDAAIVANPTALHMPVAIEAAGAGCHLLLEKPVSQDLARIDELQSALEAGGGRVLVGYQFRFNLGLRRAKRLLEDGMLGSPLYARAHWGEYLPDWHPWEDYRESYSARGDLGGGVLLTLSHAFDYLSWMLGEVEWLTAVTGRDGALEIEVETLAEVIMGHSSRAISSVHLDYLERPPRHALTFVCERGKIDWSADTSTLRWWTPEAGEWSDAQAPAGYSRNAMFLDELQHFLEIVEGQSEPVCGLEEGIRAVEIALAAAKSAAGGGRVTLGEGLRLATR